MKYTDQHEWIRFEGDIGTVGITEFAAHQMGDVVYTELPFLGQVLIQGAEAAVVESVKAASEVYAPANGEVVEINEALEGCPELVNTDPLGAGWFFKIKVLKPAELEGLMDEVAYQTFTRNSH